MTILERIAEQRIADALRPGGFDGLAGGGKGWTWMTRLPFHPNGGRRFAC